MKKKVRKLTRERLADKIFQMCNEKIAARMAREAANKKKGGHE